MKIIMGLNAPWVGGTRIHVLTLSQALIKRGHRVILVTDPGILEDELTARGIPYRIRSASTEGMVRLLLELVESEQPDIIHAHPAAFIFESYVVSQLTGVPFVVTMHGEYLMQFEQNVLGRRVGCAVGQVIAVSDRIKEYLVQRSALQSERISVIHNGIDFSEYYLRNNTAQIKKELGIRAGEKVIMYLGRLDLDKEAAITTAAEAVRRLRSLGQSVKGVFVGKGDLFDRLREKGDLILTGFRRDVPELLSIADLVIAGGRSALEALAIGKPVVGVGRAGLHGLVTTQNWERAVETNFGDHGALPKPNLAWLMPQIHRGLLQDPVESKKFRLLIQSSYDLVEVVAQLEKVYEKVRGTLEYI